MRAGRNQYPPGHGAPELVDAVIRHQQRHYGLDLAPDQVVVTTGATEAIAGAMLGLVDPGDEVVVCEPYYDSYRAMIQFAGGVRRPVTLRAPDYRLDAAELEAAVTDRTRVILLNIPHNPTGQVLRHRRARRGRRRRPPSRPRGGHRRGLRAPHLRRPRARADRHPARDVRPHRDDLELGQDLLVHRLEDRLGQRPGRPGRSRGGRQELAVVLLRALRSSRRSPTPSTTRTSFHERCATTSRGSATSCATASTRSVSRCTCRRAPTS